MTETMSYAAAVREALRTAMHDDPNVTLSGEDIGIYGGAFGISEGLLEEFGKDRIIDTPISEEAAVGAALAKAYCSEAYWIAASDSIHLHGGIAFTWEHAAHRYVRRARSSEVLFGTPDDHRARLADLLAL